MGQLTQTVTISGATVALTTVGAVDWSDFGGTSTTATDWKSGAGNTIPTPSLIGAGSSTGGYTNDPRSIGWTDGTFVPTNAGSTNGIFNAGGNSGNGFQLVLPADTNVRTVWIYLGGFDIATAATVTCSLSDGSAASQTDNTTLTGSGGTSVDGVVKLVYQANSSAQSLTLQWFINANTGNVTLQAAAVQSIVAGGGTSANLTAQTATFSEGTLTRAVGYGVAGQTGTFSEGSITRALSSALSGQTATFAEGTVTPALSTALTGQTATFTEGAIARAVSTALTGQTATFTLGTITPAVSYALSGQTATFTEGTITPSTGGNVTASLSGQTATFSLGTITATVSYGLTAQTATFSEGTISASTGTAANLTGQTATFSVGTITPSISYPVIGQTATFAEGSLIANPSYGLTGQTITSSLGTITPEVDYAVTGLTATFSEGTITPQTSGGVAKGLTGLTASFSLGVITVTGGDVVSGGPAGKHRKRYGVMDGWRLQLFDTKADADAYRTSLRKDIPAKKAKRVKLAEPAQMIDLPKLKASLPPELAAKLTQMLRDRLYGDVQELAQQAEQLRADITARQERDDLDLVTHVVHAHRQAHIAHVQGIHSALRLLHEIRRLRSIR